jgi:Fe-S-cluster-containing dehydrogenase component
MNRRAFLAVLGTAGAGLAAPGPAGTLLAGQVAATSGSEPLASLYDLSKCVGCGACVAACREAHASDFPEPKKPFPRMSPASVKAEDFSASRDMDDRLTPYNWLFVQTATVTKDGRPLDVHIPRRCMHCQNPPCAGLCPWGAATRAADGAVAIDPAICLGGAKCRTVCPWHIPQRQTGVGLYLDLLPRFAGNGVMYKCDRCQARTRAGLPPACLDACPNGVQTMGPRSAMVAAAKALARDTDGFVYGETENGGTNTFYVSPVPFATLQTALETGPGRPGLGPTDDVMGEEANLAASVFLAPVAGLAAGLLRLAGRAKSQPGKEENRG